jgi:hypothetical protein
VLGSVTPSGAPALASEVPDSSMRPSSRRASSSAATVPSNFTRAAPASPSTRSPTGGASARSSSGSSASACSARSIVSSRQRPASVPRQPALLPLPLSL